MLKIPTKLIISDYDKITTITIKVASATFILTGNYIIITQELFDDNDTFMLEHSVTPDNALKWIEVFITTITSMIGHDHTVISKEGDDQFIKSDNTGVYQIINPNLTNNNIENNN